MGCGNKFEYRKNISFNICFFIQWASSLFVDGRESILRSWTERLSLHWSRPWTQWTVGWCWSQPWKKSKVRYNQRRGHGTNGLRYLIFDLFQMRHLRQWASSRRKWGLHCSIRRSFWFPNLDYSSHPFWWLERSLIFQPFTVFFLFLKFCHCFVSNNRRYSHSG